MSRTAYSPNTKTDTIMTPSSIHRRLRGTPPLGSKSKEASPLSKHLNSRYSESQHKRSQIIERIRQRRRMSTPMNSQSISTLIEDFILPMFEADVKTKKQKKELSGSVYTKLKLSQKLAFQNSTLLDQVELLERQALETQQG